MQCSPTAVCVDNGASDLTMPPETTKQHQETFMARLKFGAFLAPHHPIGEHPMLQFRRDMDFVQQLDELGYDEFWCGEHHSSGWEMIASPEMFLPPRASAPNASSSAPAW